MAKAIAFMLLLYLVMAFGVGILQGGGGIVATPLTEAVDEDDVVLTVESTNGYLDSSVVVVEGEEISYTGTTDTTFTGCTRGYGGGSSDDHPVGAMVYTTSANVINSAMGFNVASTVDSMGVWSIIVIPAAFVFVTLPHLLMMPYMLFTGELMIFALILVAIQAAVVIVIAMSFVGARRV